MFHDHPGVANAYLTDGEPEEAPIAPLPNSKPTYWTYHELWRFLNIRFAQRVKCLVAKD